jgi:hypothetical protein
MEIPDLPQGAFEHCGDKRIKPQGGGGGIPIISDIGSALEDVGQAVGGAVEDVGQFAGNVAESQLQEIVNDPVKAATKAALIYSGNAWALPIVEGVDTYEEGGTLEEALVSGGKAYAQQQVGAELGSQLGGGEFASTGEDFNMGEGGYYTGEDFNMGGDLFTPPPNNLVANNTGVVSDYEIDPTAQALQNAIDRSDFIQDRPLTPEELRAAGIESGAPIIDYSTEATLTPGGNVVPATTLPTEMAAIDAEIAAAAKALPTTISPMKALQGLRGASGLLGGRQQQAQAYPQMQMGGVQERMPQGAVDYSGLYNLLALQNRRNPNSLLG